MDVLYVDSTGKTGWHPLGNVGPTGAWAPSPVFKLNDKTQQPTAQFRFTVKGQGSFLVDDVYTDPFIRR